jgi:hypothetical protein
MTCRTWIAAATLLACWSVTHAAEPATILGRGQAELSKPPERLRVQVEIVVRGKDPKDALARLKERRDELRRQLATLEAIADSVDFAAPAFTTDKTNQQLQMERMMIQRHRFEPVAPPSRPQPRAKEPEPVFVSTLLKVDWALPTDGDALLVRIHELQDKIKAADLGGAKELEKQATPAELEIQEEMRAFNRGEEQLARGEPTFLFVARLSDAEREQGLAKAFQSARQSAEVMARAAGGTLGGLHRLEGDANAAPENQGDIYREIYLRQIVRPGLKNGEIAGPHPGQLGFQFQVSAYFLINGKP